MVDDGPGSPLEQRVPGATGAGPDPSSRTALPDALIARMRAAVDAARQAQGNAQVAAAAEPVTEPMRALPAAVAAQDWPAAALDDLAESYLAADPDLTSGYTDDADLDDARLDDAGSRLRPSSAVTTSGWAALGGDVEPGTDVKHERAAWWDHAVRSGSTGQARVGMRQVNTARRRHLRVRVGVIALAVVLAAGGAVALAMSSRDNARHGNLVPSGYAKAAKIRAEARQARLAADIASAARWVALQVSQAAKVACDPATCQVLAEHGIAGHRLDELGSGAAGPFSAAILVDTPVLRQRFGTSRTANWAPIVLAGFGVGTDQTTVRAVAPHGAHTYEAALRADRKQRQMVGSSLLTSSQITTTRAARSALVAGDVDDRLLLVITALASQHPIDIVAFGRTWPGASKGIPMRCAYLAETDAAAYLTKAVYVQAMMDLLRVQPPPYRPVHIALVRLAGRDVMSIWYPAPSPLGLISPGN